MSTIVITYATSDNQTAEVKVERHNLRVRENQIKRDGGAILSLVPEHSLGQGPVNLIGDDEFIDLLDMILAHEGDRAKMRSTGIHLHDIRSYLAGATPADALRRHRFFDAFGIDELWPENRFMQAVYLEAVSRFEKRSTNAAKDDPVFNRVASPYTAMEEGEDQ